MNYLQYQAKTNPKKAIVNLLEGNIKGKSISGIARELKIDFLTAIKYINQLKSDNILTERQIGRGRIINVTPK